MGSLSHKQRLAHIRTILSYQAQQLEANKQWLRNAASDDDIAAMAAMVMQEKADDLSEDEQADVRQRAQQAQLRFVAWNMERSSSG